MHPFLYSYFCKHRVYPEIGERISKEILSANIKIIQQTYKGESTGYSTGFGGVIFKRTGNKYYAITAHHAVDSLNNTKLIVLANIKTAILRRESNGGKYLEYCSRVFREITKNMVE